MANLPTITHILGHYYHHSHKDSNYVIFIKEGHKYNKYINGTKICAKYNKRIVNWSCSRITSIIESHIIKNMAAPKDIDLTFVVSYSPTLSEIFGTYIHPLLFNSLMIWINPAYILNITQKLNAMYKENTLLEKAAQNNQIKQTICIDLDNRIKGIQKILLSTAYKGCLSNVECLNMRLDILTSDAVIKIVPYTKVASIIGNMLLCAEYYPNDHIILFVYDVPENNNMKNMMYTYSKYGILLNIYKD